MDGDGREREATTAEALAAWRAASRESEHAQETLTTAELAQVAAEKAAQAARGTAESARAAVEAAIVAEVSAKATADAARQTREHADSDLAEARANVEAMGSAERVAGERHGEIQNRAYKRNGYGKDADAEPETSSTA